MAAVTVETHPTRASWDRLVGVVGWLPLRLMAVLFAAYVVAMGIGASQFEAGRLGSGQLDLDAEGRVFAVVSGLILLSGGALVVLAVLRRITPPHLLLLGALLVFMGLDEIATIHERLESATGIDWVVLYLPLMALAGLAALDLLRRARDRWVSWLLVLGGACWAVAVLFEKLEWPNGDESLPAAHYVALMIPEELLEITGAYLIANALALLVRHHQASRAASRQVAASS
jgi:hypothetical protein